MSNNSPTLRTFETPGGVYNATPPRIVFGANKASQIASEVTRLKAQRALILCTPGRTDMAEQLAKQLGKSCAGIYPHAISQVPIEMAETARSYTINNNIDCLIAIGGGAAVGLAKGIALETKCPYIAIPTTYSGSEMTAFCGITIDGVKRMHSSLNMLASTVIYDPELTLGLPAHISAESAMNAMAHCIEALYVATASPVSALAAIEGIRKLSQSIPTVVKDPTNTLARQEALYGAYLGGIALTGGFALHHGVAHVLGASYGIPHATSHSIALPYVTAYNMQFLPKLKNKIAAALGAQDAADGIYDFAVSIGAAVNLSEHGMSANDIDRCTELVIETDNGLNPRPVSTNGVKQILELALAGKKPNL